MADLMKRAVVKFNRIVGREPESFVLGVIDITHVYLIYWDGKEPLTDEQISEGTIYHVAQFKAFPESILYPSLYEAVWDWLRGISEIEGKTFLW